MKTFFFTLFFALIGTFGRISAQKDTLNHFQLVHGGDPSEWKYQSDPWLTFCTEEGNLVVEAHVSQFRDFVSDENQPQIDLWLDFSRQVPLDYIYYHGGLYLIDGQADLDNFWSEIQDPVVRDWSFGQLRYREMEDFQMQNQEGFEGLPVWEDGNYPPQKQTVPFGLLHYKLVLDSGAWKVLSGWENAEAEGFLIEPDQDTPQSTLMPSLFSERPSLVKIDFQNEQDFYRVKATFPPQALGFIPKEGISSFKAKAEIHLWTGNTDFSNLQILSSTAQSGPYQTSHGREISLNSTILPRFSPYIPVGLSKADEEKNPFPGFFRFEQGKWQGWEGEISEIGSWARYHSWSSRFSEPQIYPVDIIPLDTGVGKLGITRIDFPPRESTSFCDWNEEWVNFETPNKVVLMALDQGLICQNVLSVFAYPDLTIGALVQHWGYTYGEPGGGMCGSSVDQRFELVRFTSSEVQRQEIYSGNDCWPNWSFAGREKSEWVGGEDYFLPEKSNFQWIKPGRELKVSLSETVEATFRWNQKKKEWEIE
ncbi:MAG: hypothetical protein H6581_13030 [Bacteroidia bacterium]|nr:hypothetical protein [Bacteroidia bacterium]